MGISWGYVGPAWELDCFSLRLGGPILELCWPILGLRCPILRATWAHLGAMLAHLRAVLAHLGAMLAHLGAMLAHFGGYVVPSWGLCCPILGLCSPILRPMLTHLEPQAPKKRKKRKSKIPCKTQDILAVRGGRRQGRRPLSPTERRETPSAMPRPGGPWPDFWADAPRRLRRTTRPSISSQCGRDSY